MRANNLDNYVSVNEAATRLGVHHTTIRRMIYAGKLPHVRIGRAIRIPLDALKFDALAN